ncbi:MAG: cell division protein FtsA [Candidatus Omnitrophica bacterium CG1_02_49_10]|nr:MAG: cell division protein FtsA [Candidatus Omnitrophica bacterium CG1_02_49_10]
MRKKRMLAALDIGTAKLCAVASGGFREEDGAIEIAGAVIRQAGGFKGGVVVDLARASDGISNIMSELSDEVGAKLDVITVGLGCRQVASLDLQVAGRVESANGQITKKDADALFNILQTRDIPLDRKPIHILLKDFIIDGQEGIKEPVGMYGSRIEMKSQVITASRNLTQNLIKAIDLAGLSVDDIVMSIIADSKIVLTGEERESVTALINIGGDVTEIGIFQRDLLRYFDSVPSGGMPLTEAISRHFKIPFKEAEDIKVNHAGLYYEQDKGADLMINEDGTRRRLISRLELNSVLNENVKSILSSVKLSLAKSGMTDELSSNIVMTGGSAIMDGLIERAEDIIGMPVRLGLPRNVACRRSEVINPAYSTAIGLLKYTMEERERRRSEASAGKLNSLALRLKNMVRDYF